MELAQLSRAAPLAVAGEGASWAFAEAIGATYLPGDPVSAAEQVASSHVATRDLAASRREEAEMAAQVSADTPGMQSEAS